MFGKASLNRPTMGPTWTWSGPYRGVVWDRNKTIDIGEWSICGGGWLEMFYCIYIYMCVCVYACHMVSSVTPGICAYYRSLCGQLNWLLLAVQVNTNILLLWYLHREMSHLIERLIQQTVNMLASKSHTFLAHPIIAHQKRNKSFGCLPNLYLSTGCSGWIGKTKAMFTHAC